MYPRSLVPVEKDELVSVTFKIAKILVFLVKTENSELLIMEHKHFAHYHITKYLLFFVQNYRDLLVDSNKCRLHSKDEKGGFVYLNELLTATVITCKRTILGI